MSDSPNIAFGKLVPGFDFLQSLAASAAKGAAQGLPQLPSLGNWVAPTLNVEEVDKRIGELKAVQFWLDQNATALKATIQALEVQRMTLSTLKGMNFDLAQMAEAFKLKLDTPAPAIATTPAGVLDPMQWWGALTQQFQGIAASALKDVAQQATRDPAKNLAARAGKAKAAAARPRRGAP